MKSSLSRLALVAGLGLGMVSLGVQAAVDWTWTLNGSPTGSNLPGAASVMGYSASTNSAALVATSGAGLPDLAWYSGTGYGICSTGDASLCGTAPDHAMDNNGYKESILLSFGSKVTLGWIDINWSGNQNGYDGDVSVLAYTGASNPVSGATTYGSIASALSDVNSGWKLIGNYANTSQNVTPSIALSTTVSASYWLVAAYNSVFAGACKDASTGSSSASCTDGNDYVKVYAVAGSTAVPPPPGQVSEPAAMLLLGTGLLGIWGLRRRQMVTPI